VNSLSFYLSGRDQDYSLHLDEAEKSNRSQSVKAGKLFSHNRRESKTEVACLFILFNIYKNTRLCVHPVSTSFL